MNTFIGYQNQQAGIIENDFCIVNYDTEEITWKSGMYNPKLRNDILYWFNEKNK
tara:strand:- start:330 stop:491 length:162 start_codon:yes stop_codon:yes gene_type:complete